MAISLKDNLTSSYFNAKRIAALQKEMPTALKYYHPAKNTKKR